MLHYWQPQEDELPRDIAGGGGILRLRLKTLRYIFEPDEIVQGQKIDDDPYLPPAPWAQPRQPQPSDFGASDEIAHLSPDEDYAPQTIRVRLWHTAWNAGTAPPVAPIPADDDTYPLLLGPLPDALLYMVAPWAWGSSADDIAVVGNTVAPAEEDYWQNGVLPVPATLAWPAPASFDQHELSPPGQPEEEFWRNTVAPVPWGYAPLWPHTLDPQDELSVPGQPDEDFWTSGVAPQGYALAPLPVWAWDPQDEQAFGLVPPPPVVVPVLLWVNPFLVQPHIVQPHRGQSFPTIGPN